MQMLDPVLAIRHLKSEVKRKKRPLSHTGATNDGDAGQVPHKKLKVFLFFLLDHPVSLSPVNHCSSD